MKNPTTKTRTPAKTKDEPIKLVPVTDRFTRPVTVTQQDLFPGYDEPGSVADAIRDSLHELRVCEAAVMVGNGHEQPSDQIAYTLCHIQSRIERQLERLDAMQERWNALRDGKAGAS